MKNENMPFVEGYLRACLKTIGKHLGRAGDLRELTPILEFRRLPLIGRFSKSVLNASCLFCCLTSFFASAHDVPVHQAITSAAISSAVQWSKGYQQFYVNGSVLTFDTLREKQSARHPEVRGRMQNLNETRSAVPIHFPFLRGLGISLSDFAALRLCVKLLYPGCPQPHQHF
jgi:hypothetical protein